MRNLLVIYGARVCAVFGKVADHVRARPTMKGTLDKHSL
jgi:hypothetical protein